MSTKEQGAVYRVILPQNLDDLTNQVNIQLAQISDRLDKIEGLRGTPEFRSAIDLKGNKITGLSDGVADTDAISVSQLNAALSNYSTTDEVQTALITLNDKAVTREFEAVYQNTQKKPLYISITFTQSGTPGNCTVLVDDVTPPVNTTAGVWTDASKMGNIFFVVPKGWYYKVSATATILYWIEIT